MSGYARRLKRRRGQRLQGVAARSGGVEQRLAAPVLQQAVLPKIRVMRGIVAGVLGLADSEPAVQRALVRGRMSRTLLGAAYIASQVVALRSRDGCQLIVTSNHPLMLTFLPVRCACEKQQMAPACDA